MIKTNHNFADMLESGAQNIEIYRRASIDMQAFARQVIATGQAAIVERDTLKTELALSAGTLESRDRNIETLAEENRRLIAERDALKRVALEHRDMRLAHAEELSKLKAQEPIGYTTSNVVCKLREDWGWARVYGKKDAIFNTPLYLAAGAQDKEQS